MVLYRRNLVPGATYFFTLTLADRSSRLLVEHVDLLRGAFSQVRARHTFDIIAAVVLPDHLHCMWRLPEGDDRYAMRWRMIKGGFTAALGKRGISTGRREHGQRKVWQRRYWEHTIRDDEDFKRHVDYIHFNPVKHGHVRRVMDWPYSSFHRFVARGVLPVDLAGADARRIGALGE